MPAEARSRILVVDDHVEMGRLLADELADAGFVVEVATGGEAALAIARKRPPDLVITDLRMEQSDGFAVLDGIRALDPGTPVLLMTAFGSIETAIEAMRRGAWHYLTKPFKLAEVLLWVERALETRTLRDENRALRAQVRRGLDLLVGDSVAMRRLHDRVARAAQSDAPALLRGESGTGKELVARALHEAGPRRERPFVAVNCTALPEALLESELFGHVRGAFTGASATRRGLFVEADGGTLFLDEIGDMAPELQARLLRVLEDGLVRAVGSDAARRVDVRIVAATHRSLEERVASGAFRSDLFYRLDVVPIHVPPLRDRREDIPLLVAHLLDRARQNGPSSTVERFSPELVRALEQRPWPGNVRELDNVVRRLVALSAGPIADVEDLRALVPEAEPGSPLDAARSRIVPLRELQDDYIAWAIRECGGNKTRAAELLGIDVSTIHRRTTR